MTADPRQRISDITEMPDNNLGDDIGNILASVGWATLTGTVAMTLAVLLTTPMATGASAGAIAGIIFAVLLSSSIATALISTIGVLLVGLPVAFIMRAMRLESVAAYTAIGFILGLAILTVAFIDWGDHDWRGLVFVSPGAIAGAACAYRWALYRTSRPDPATELADADEPEPPANPIHDLLF